MKAIITGLLLSVITATGIGCRSKTALDPSGTPYQLVVGIYEGDNPGELTKALEPVRAYLSKKLGMPVVFQETTDYSSVIEALMTKKVHMAYLSPFPYVLTTQKMKLVPIVVPGRNGQPAFYHSLIVTGAGSGIHSMDDLKVKSHSLTLCFADPISTSGHLVPRAYLRSINLDPTTSFKQTLFAGSHFASILMAKTGKVDVACAFNYALDKLIREKTIKPGDIVVLWQSDPIEQNPIAMRPDINPAFTEKVKQAYLDMKKDDSVAFRSYLSIYMPNDVSSMSYIPFADADFDGVRKLVKGIDPSDIKN